ncbi:MAG: hypothetical protein Q8R66_07205 [Methanobacteriaceae archaeon]|nr:hypothetical protein [Methanobacteriaceae archaeon]
MINSKENDDKTLDLDKYNRKPTEVELSIGTLRFKSLSMKDTLFVLKLLKEDLNPKEFTLKLLYNQLIESVIEFSLFREIKDDELKFTAKKYIEDEYHLSKFYKDEGNFFNDFKLCLDNYINSMFKSVSSSLSTINKFNISYPTISTPIFQVTPIIDFNSMIKQSNTSFNRLAFGQYFDKPLINTSNLFQNFSSLIKNTIQPQIAAWNNWADYNQNLFKSFFNQQQNLLSNFSIEIPVINKSLKDYQWFITPAIPGDLIYEAFKLCGDDANKRNEINQLYYSHFSSDNFLELEKMTEYWKSTDVLKITRTKIIDSCVNVLKTKDETIKPSYLVVPTLMTQIDGIEQELMKKNQLTPFRGQWRDNDDKTVTRADFYSDENEGLILSSAKSILLEVLYQNAYPGCSLNSPINFNRHKIAHGELLNYGTKYNVIRSFLILDFIIRLYAADE